MGESLVEAPKVDNKMGESVTQVAWLKESVSFGRFENDSLCWERWSTFPTNKYLEEVEKCSTPGSVARKAAYFEAHYKKIAARKAEILDQEKRRETESVNSEDLTHTLMNSVCDSSEEVSDVEKSSAHNFVGVTEVENEMVNSKDEVGDESYGSEITKENEVVNFTGEVKNEMVNSKDEVGDSSYVHVDVLSHGSEITEEENEVVNLTSEVNENVDPMNDGVGIIEDENEVAISTCEVSEHIDESNFTIEVSEHIDEPNDAVGIIDDEDGLANFTSKHIDEPNDEAVIVEENKDLEPEPQDDIASEALCHIMESPELEKPEEPVLMKEETASVLVFQDEEELPQDKVEAREIAKKGNEDLVKLENPMKMQKATSVKKTTSTINAKKKPTSPMPKRCTPSMPKSPLLSTPKSSKGMLSKTIMSTTRPSVKKENGITPLTGKKATRPQISKRVLPTSLHMSLSLVPANSDSTALPTTRKSLIMESMGDKDIVKRAFRAFRNVSRLSPSSLDKTPPTNQFKKIEQKQAPSDTVEKKNERITTPVKEASRHFSQQGTRKTLPSPGLRKTGGVDQRNGKSVPASCGSRFQDQRNKSEEVPKKLEQISKTNDAGKTYLQSKGKVEQAAQIKKPSQSINSKARLSSSYNQGRGFFSGSAHKNICQDRSFRLIGDTSFFW